MRAIWGDYDGDLEVSEFLDFCKGLRVFVYSLLDVLHPYPVKSPLRKAARLAGKFGVDSDQLGFLSRGRDDKTPEATARGSSRDTGYSFLKGYLKYSR